MPRKPRHTSSADIDSDFWPLPSEFVDDDEDDEGVIEKRVRLQNVIDLTLSEVSRFPDSDKKNTEYRREEDLRKRRYVIMSGRTSETTSDVSYTKRKVKLRFNTRVYRFPPNEIIVISSDDEDEGKRTKSGRNANSSRNPTTARVVKVEKGAKSGNAHKKSTRNSVIEISDEESEGRGNAQGTLASVKQEIPDKNPSRSEQWNHDWLNHLIKQASERERAGLYQLPLLSNQPIKQELFDEDYTPNPKECEWECAGHYQPQFLSDGSQIKHEPQPCSTGGMVDPLQGAHYAHHYYGS